MACAASIVKLVMGVSNNTTYIVMQNALDAIKKHPNYKHQVKRKYLQAFDAYRANELQLRYAESNRMFHIADMGENLRKRYGNITDAQYFEYWTGLAAKPYKESEKWLNSLSYKYEKSLKEHGVKHADKIAQVMTATACLELSCKMYRSTLESCGREMALPYPILDEVFKFFHLRGVADIWKDALVMTDTASQSYELNDDEQQNIRFGLEQLEECWSDPKMIYGSVFAATADFEEIFRTKGENKKALREISEMLQLANEDIHGR